MPAGSGILAHCVSITRVYFPGSLSSPGFCLRLFHGSHVLPILGIYDLCHFRKLPYLKSMRAHSGFTGWALILIVISWIISSLISLWSHPPVSFRPRLSFEEVQALASDFLPAVGRWACPADLGLCTHIFSRSIFPFFCFWYQKSNTRPCTCQTGTELQPQTQLSIFLF